MKKKEFYTRWERAHKITCRTFEMFPTDALDKVIIPGLRPPGKLFCHIYSHMNASLNACISGTLTRDAIAAVPEDVDTTDRKQALRFAQSVMEQVFAHASVSQSVWDQEIKTPWGNEPMRTLCLDAFGHEMHHSGQLSAMLRILNITPPAVCQHD